MAHLHLTVEDKDLKNYNYALDLLMNTDGKRERFMEELKQQECFFQLFTEYKDKEERITGGSFLKFTALLLGVLFSSNGKKFPIIKPEDIDRILKDSFRQKKKIRKKIQNLNPCIKRFFKGLPRYLNCSHFGMNCVYQLANIVLIRIEEELS